MTKKIAIDTSTTEDMKKQKTSVPKSKGKKTAPAKTTTKLKASMNGKASPAKAAEGDKPVFAYIASLPQLQRGIATRIDALAAKTLPGLQRSVKWGMAYHGVDGGWCFASGAFVGHMKLMFIRGTDLKPVPPVTPVAMGQCCEEEVIEDTYASAIVGSVELRRVRTIFGEGTLTMTLRSDRPVLSWSEITDLALSMPDSEKLKLAERLKESGVKADLEAMFRAFRAPKLDKRTINRAVKVVRARRNGTKKRTTTAAGR